MTCDHELDVSELPTGDRNLKFFECNVCGAHLVTTYVRDAAGRITSIQTEVNYREE